MIDRSTASMHTRRDALRPRSGTSAKALLLTVLGMFVAPRSGEVWTQSLIAALETVGIEERNARQALSRVSECQSEYLASLARLTSILRLLP